MLRILSWIGARIETTVPLLAVPTFFSMVAFIQGEVSTWQRVLVYSLAIGYVGIVLWSPMALPAKQPLTVSRDAARRSVLLVSMVVLVGVAVLVLASLLSESGGEGKTRLPFFILVVVMIIAFGSGGALSERGLALDLLPIIRHREPRRIIYALVASFFLAMLTFFWNNLFSGVIESIRQAAGEAGSDIAAAAASFDLGTPFLILLQLLVGAGLFEELLFRLGIMTIVWRFTRRWGLGLLVSALLFGLYHLTPLSGISTYNAGSPLTTVLTSFTMGIIMGAIFRYRGFTTAVLVHGFGDWVVVMLLGSSAG